MRYASHLLICLGLAGAFGAGSGCSDPDQICTVLYDSGELRSKVPCPNGVSHGQMEIYSKNGALWCTKEYIDGEVQDTMRFFFPSGEVQRTVPMKDGKKKRSVRLLPGRWFGETNH
jgi:antitoxin component YwqK of YwqJK toxin-antitoxin module